MPSEGGAQSRIATAKRTVHVCEDCIQRAELLVRANGLALTDLRSRTVGPCMIEDWRQPWGDEG